LVFLFAILVAGISRAIELPFSVLGVVGLVFSALGVVMTVLTVRLREPRARKACFLVTGISAAGIPVCVVLHNLVYALFIALFGENFWGPDGDEPVFFILGILVFPILFLIGAAASGILLLRKERMENRTTAPSKDSD
jgi:hypothetical protein